MPVETRDREERSQVNNDTEPHDRGRPETSSLDGSNQCHLRAFFLQADKVDPKLDGTVAYLSLSAVHRHGPFLARRLILSASIGLGLEPLFPGKESRLR